MTLSSARPLTDLERADPRRDAVKRAIFAEVGTRIGRHRIARITTRVLDAIDSVEALADDGQPSLLWALRRIADLSEQLDRERAGRVEGAGLRVVPSEDTP